MGWCKHDYLPTRKGFSSFTGILHSGSDHLDYTSNGVYELYNGESVDYTDKGTYSWVRKY